MSLYAETLMSQIGDWLQESPDAPIIMGGVIGTREGWSVAPYYPCPVSPDILAQNLHPMPDEHLGPLKGRKVFMVPGLKVVHPGERRYVMRGEEIKAFGAIGLLPGNKENLLYMPGTHCQWLRMDGSTISAFWTFLTGELFDTMTRHGLDFIFPGLPKKRMIKDLSIEASRLSNREEIF